MTGLVLILSQIVLGDAVSMWRAHVIYGRPWRLLVVLVSLGAIEIGVLVAYFLSGITGVQTFLYYQSDFRQDQNLIRVLVSLPSYLHAMKAACAQFLSRSQLCCKFVDVSMPRLRLTLLIE